MIKKLGYGTKAAPYTYSLTGNGEQEQNPSQYGLPEKNVLPESKFGFRRPIKPKLVGDEASADIQNEQSRATGGSNV